MTTTITLARNRIGEARGRRLVAERSAGWCELCAKNRATRWHARISHDDGGTWSPDNGLHTCGTCKHRLEHPATPEDAARYFRLGWLVQPGQDPTLVSVQINVGGRFLRFLLTNDGDYDEAYPTELDEAS